MTIREFYVEIGEDFDNVKGRLIDDERIARFVKRFPEGNELKNIEEAVADGCLEEAFDELHKLKGIALNLGFSRLCEISSTFCEVLRNGNPSDNDISELMKNVRGECEIIMQALSKL